MNAMILWSVMEQLMQLTKHFLVPTPLWSKCDFKSGDLILEKSEFGKNPYSRFRRRLENGTIISPLSFRECDLKDNASYMYCLKDDQVIAKVSANQGITSNMMEMGDGNFVTASSIGSLKIWSSNDLKLLGDLTIASDDSGFFNLVKLDEKSFIAIQYKENVRIWSYPELKVIHECDYNDEYDQTVCGCDVHRDIVVVAGDKYLLLYKLHQNYTLGFHKRLDSKSGFQYHDAAFLPNGFLVATTWNSTVSFEFWNPFSGELLCIGKLNGETPSFIRIFEDRKQIMIAGDSSLFFYDISKYCERIPHFYNGFEGKKSRFAVVKFFYI